MVQSEDRLQLTLYKLRSLLDFTLLMGEESDVARLMQRFTALLKDDLGINRILFFARDEEGKWALVWNEGCVAPWVEAIDVERDLMEYDRTVVIRSQKREVLPEIDVVIPLAQDELVSGFVLLGDTREDVIGVSPIIKHLTFARTLSMLTYVALQNYNLLRRALRERSLKQELELATQLQNMLLLRGDALPRMKGIEIATEYFPQYEVGGDFYDLLDLGHGYLGFCIADVSGKGISAAMVMTSFQANYRSLMSREASLCELVSLLNARLYGLLRGERFITLFVGRYDTATRRLEYVNAGHNPPYLYNRATGEAQWLDASTVGLGMVEEMPQLRKSEITLHDDSVLFCYTDGLVERRDREGKEHYSTDVIETSVRRYASAAEVVSSARKTVEAERESGVAIPFDDVTMMVLHFTK